MDEAVQIQLSHCSPSVNVAELKQQGNALLKPIGDYLTTCRNLSSMEFTPEYAATFANTPSGQSTAAAIVTSCLFLMFLVLMLPRYVHQDPCKAKSICDKFDLSSSRLCVLAIWFP